MLVATDPLAHTPTMVQLWLQRGPHPWWHTTPTSIPSWMIMISASMLSGECMPPRTHSVRFRETSHTDSSSFCQPK